MITLSQIVFFLWTESENKFYFFIVQLWNVSRYVLVKSPPRLHLPWPYRARRELFTAAYKNNCFHFHL